MTQHIITAAYMGYLGHLSCASALFVAQWLRDSGVPEWRCGCLAAAAFFSNVVILLSVLCR